MVDALIIAQTVLCPTNFNTEIHNYSDTTVIVDGITWADFKASAMSTSYMSSESYEALTYIEKLLLDALIFAQNE